MRNRNMNIKSTLLSLVAVVFSANVNAAVISVDWQTTGDNLITTDTVSGLDWLDLSATVSLPYDYVLSEQVAGGEFSGWRYATTDEVTTMLLSNFGIDLYDGNTTTGPLPAGLAQATSYLGDTTSVWGTSYTGLTGITSQDRLPSDGHLVVGADYNFDIQMFFRRIDSDLNTSFQGDGRVSASVGHWLVATTPWEPEVSAVPVPAAVWLFGSGLLGLIGVARRKKA